MAENSENRTHVFLFDADTPEFGGCYGYPCNKALFTSVLENESNKLVHSRIYSGDILLHNLCTEISEVRKTGDSSSTTYIVDNSLYITLVTELAQTIKEVSNTVKVQDLCMLLAKHNVYCIVLTNLADSVRDLVDISMQNQIGYVGAFEIDKGNPLHIILFIESLISHGFLKQDTLYLEKEPYLDDEILPDWARETPMLKVKIINHESFQQQAPPLIFPSVLSARGERFRNIMKIKGKEDHYQKIASELLHNQNNDFHYTVNGKLLYSNIIVPKEKLTEYALNFEHSGDGKSKAKVFNDLLGITKENWRYLAAQLENGLADGKLCNVRRTDYGIQYHIDIPVKGLNGVSKTVRTAWITRNNTTISLVTVYIVDEKYQQNIEGEEPPIVNSPDQNDFWETLYNLAHNEAVKASNRVIPTPMYITDYTEPVMDGLCGFAYIVIKDARKGFAKWLKSKNIGYRCYKGGWEIFAETDDQSFERARAYAETFEKILQQNGVECYSVSGLD
jgi:hypothetical protein